MSKTDESTTSRTGELLGEIAKTVYMAILTNATQEDGSKTIVQLASGLIDLRKELVRDILAEEEACVYRCVSSFMGDLGEVKIFAPVASHLRIILQAIPVPTT